MPYPRHNPFLKTLKQSIESEHMMMRLLIVFLFISHCLGPMPQVYAQELHLPSPGVMVHLSPAYNPPILKGIKVHADNPFRFEFILDKGDDRGGAQELTLKEEATRLTKYFLASITTPEKDLWVNLSPYEKDRIIPHSFGLTEMGRDLLAQDYILKQITASLIYPEDEIGKKFWKRVYEEAAKRYGTTNIPVNTFNKVWIVPDKAIVYENLTKNEGRKTKDEAVAYVVESRLKVMLEEDYLAISKNGGVAEGGETRGQDPDIKQVSPTDPPMADQGVGVNPRTQIKSNSLGSQIIREIIIPELTKEVNENKNFAQLRQVYNSLILATWYKKKIRDSILAKVYADKNKTAGIEYQKKFEALNSKNETNSKYLMIKRPKRLGHSDFEHLNLVSPVLADRPGSLEFRASKLGPQEIYNNYLKAFKKGVYNYIKEDIDPVAQETVPRKYFSGGTSFEGTDASMTIKPAQSAVLPQGISDSAMLIEMNVKPVFDKASLSLSERAQGFWDGKLNPIWGENMGPEIYLEILDYGENIAGNSFGNEDPQDATNPTNIANKIFTNSIVNRMKNDYPQLWSQQGEKFEEYLQNTSNGEITKKLQPGIAQLAYRYAVLAYISWMETRFYSLSVNKEASGPNAFLQVRWEFISMAGGGAYKDDFNAIRRTITNLNNTGTTPSSNLAQRLVDKNVLSQEQAKTMTLAILPDEKMPSQQVLRSGTHFNIKYSTFLEYATSEDIDGLIRLMGSATLPKDKAIQPQRYQEVAAGAGQEAEDYGIGEIRGISVSQMQYLDSSESMVFRYEDKVYKTYIGLQMSDLSRYMGVVNTVASEVQHRTGSRKIKVGQEEFDVYYRVNPITWFGRSSRGIIAAESPYCEGRINQGIDSDIPVNGLLNPIDGLNKEIMSYTGINYLALGHQNNTSIQVDRQAKRIDVIFTDITNGVIRLLQETNWEEYYRYLDHSMTVSINKFMATHDKGQVDPRMLAGGIQANTSEERYIKDKELVKKAVKKILGGFSLTEQVTDHYVEDILRMHLHQGDEVLLVGEAVSYLPLILKELGLKVTVCDEVPFNAGLFPRGLNKKETNFYELDDQTFRVYQGSLKNMPLANKFNVVMILGVIDGLFKYTEDVLDFHLFTSQEATDLLQQAIARLVPGGRMMVNLKYANLREDSFLQIVKNPFIRDGFTFEDTFPMIDYQLISREIEPPRSGFTLIAPQPTGGIDLTTSDKALVTSVSGEGPAFSYDPHELAQWQKAPGFEAKIVAITPLSISIREFMGVS